MVPQPARRSSAGNVGSSTLRTCCVACQSLCQPAAAGRGGERGLPCRAGSRRLLPQRGALPCIPAAQARVRQATQGSG
eukprot:11171521-Lingulodinium_polyedra.AAC.1